MPIYDYVCSSCGQVTEVIHGIDAPGPNFCPVCGKEGTLRKSFAAPAVLFKGSGWAKKDRSASSGARAKPGASGSSERGDGTGKGADEAATTSGPKSDSKSGSDAGGASDAGASRTPKGSSTSRPKED